MNLMLVKTVAVGFVISAAPAFAALPQVEDYCWAKAAHSNPRYGYPYNGFRVL